MKTACIVNRMFLLPVLLVMVILQWSCIKPSSNFPPDNTQVKLDSTNLPIVWIEVGGDSIMRSSRIEARMKIIYNGEGKLNYADTVAHPGQHIEYQGYIGIRHRGNSTYNNSPKKPYSLRTLSGPYGRDKKAKKRKVKLLGMGKNSNWALLAPYADKSLMRDLLTRQLTEPWMQFTPQGRFCELYLDGIYYGVYVLSEVVSKGKHRLDLQAPGNYKDGLTGDYLLEVDCNDEPTYVSKHHPVLSDGTPLTSHRILIQYKSPELKDLLPEQITYINGRINAMEEAIIAGRYDQYIDVMSFIDYQLMTELCHNVDGYRLSGKFYKRKDSVDPRFKMVLWDTDLAYGNADHRQAWRTDTWMYQNNDIMLSEKEVYMIPCWWYWLNNDSSYTAQLKARWHELRTSCLTNEHIMATVDSLANVLTSYGAETRNSQAWPRWGVHVWPNHYVAANHADEVAYIKQWLNDRLAWMDEHLEISTK